MLGVTPRELLQVYDEQVRGSFSRRTPVGWSVTRDGPLIRCLTGSGRGFAMPEVSMRELSGDELHALVERAVGHFAAHEVRFEWKTFDHDRADLVDVLLRRGFVAREHEALVLGRTEDLLDSAELAPGLVLRQVHGRPDLQRVAALESEVWAEDWSFLVEDLAARVSDPVEPAYVFVVEDPAVDRVVSAAWLVPLAGTEVAGLWGGSTLAGYRGRGIYRTLVAIRAGLARDLGRPVLQVDASEDSRPILQRLGLQVVGGTTPYVWSPPASDPGRQGRDGCLSG